MNNDFPFDHFLNIPKNNQPNIASMTQDCTESLKPESNKDEGFSENELDFVNKEISEKIKDKIPAIKFSTFFGDVFTLVNIRIDHVEFATTTEYIKTVIENNYLEDIKQSVFQVLGKNYDIKIIVFQSNKSLSSNTNNLLNNLKTEPAMDEEVAISLSDVTANDVSFNLDLVETRKDKLADVETKSMTTTNGKFNFIVDPKKTFDNFVVGPSNNMAYASAHAVAKNPGKVYPCLYLHSNSGLGKTHLLHAVANKVKQDDPRHIICITTAREFMTEMIDAVANKNIANFRKKYSEDIDVLMIDDVHELKNKQGTQNEFFHVFNELHNKGKQLIFTSDKHPKDIDGIEERIKTRLSWGLVLDIQKPDLETRIAILKNKASEEDIYLPQDVINLIATSIKSNIRELEGSLIRLAAYASVFNVDIDVEIAKEQLNLNSIKDQSFITIESLTKSVSQYFKVPIADLKSKSRLKEVAHARHIAMYLIYNLAKPTPTYVEIGKFFGGRDHTSVLHAVEKIRKQSKLNQLLSQTLLEIENNL